MAKACKALKGLCFKVIKTNFYKLFKRAARLSKLGNTWKAFKYFQEYLTFVRLLRVKASKACEGLRRWCDLYALVRVCAYRVGVCGWAGARTGVGVYIHIHKHFESFSSCLTLPVSSHTAAPF